MSEEASLQLLFSKVQHTRLRSSINAVKSSRMTGTTISYTMAANHFSTATSELTEYISNNERNLSGIQVGDGTKGGNDIYNGDGSINNGHIPNLKTLPFKDQKLVIYESKQQGIRYKGKVVQNPGNVVIKTTQQLIPIVSSY